MYEICTEKQCLSGDGIHRIQHYPEKIMPSNGIRLPTSSKLPRSPVGFGKTLRSIISINGKPVVLAVCEEKNVEKKCQ